MQEIGGTHAHDRYEAEVQHLVRTLRSYGVLTTERLCEASGARNWHGGTFEGALSAAASLTSLAFPRFCAKVAR